MELWPFPQSVGGKTFNKKSPGLFEGMTGLDGLPRMLCAMSKLDVTSLKYIHSYVLRKAYQVLTQTRLDSHPL